MYGIPTPYILSQEVKNICKLNHIKMNRMFTFLSSPIPICILVSFFLIFHTPNVRAEEEEILARCSNTSNYIPGTQFETNLNLLLESLVSNGSQDGYFNTSVGGGFDIVYGLAQCRDDLSTASCLSCLSSAAVNITLNCPNSVNATLRYDRCMIRYSNTRFFAQRGSPPRAIYYLQNITEASFDRFTQQRDGLLNNLSTIAVSRPTRFSFGDTDFMPTLNIYGVVQCTRDLSQFDCAYCLIDIIAWIPNCCNQSKGAVISSPTCYLRYDIEMFLGNTSESPSPVPAPTSPPLLSPPALLPRPSPPPARTVFSNTTNTNESNGSDGGKFLNILLILVPIIASLL